VSLYYYLPSFLKILSFNSIFPKSTFSLLLVLLSDNVYEMEILNQYSRTNDMHFCIQFIMN
jgi:hypothetical protein